MIRLHDLRVADVMTAAPFCLDASANVSEAYTQLIKRGVSGAPVLAGDGTMLGVASAHDLLACSAMDDDKSKTVGDVLQGEPVTCARETSLAEACRLMVRNRAHRVVVLGKEGESPVGMLSAIDVARAVACVDELAQESAGRFASVLAALGEDRNVV